MDEKIETMFLEGLSLKRISFIKLNGLIKEAITWVIDCYKNNGKLLIFGNGGSAADAQHMATELVSQFKRERKALGAIALTTNSSIVTAHANDFNFNAIFERQVEALAQKKDIVVGISTSGNSENVIQALKKAKSMGIKTITLTGNDGGRIGEIADLNLIVPSENTPRIQEIHIFLIHVICELVEETLFRHRRKK